ncbi:TetR family transcriptional regulator [Intrasporangium oryzae NRRL B-24470]|uniref:TetR family transcriptional regulator n=1 Tax=Intrasporangium oryzae NRRL B-24470 TaxID=1386089 RepID=W9GBC5_9MICO|nr:TetR/AcrR family transcriptional regulator [Intrasporangium oryzae]EWT03385.1 TetR family transcriptional regulator [Intrasporangium oryzae NRRL B-24470]
MNKAEDEVSRATPRARQRAATEAEILEVALAQMGSHGVAALNLSEVARQVGLRQPSLFRYFPSRLALYDALFAQGMRAHRDAVAAALAQGSGGWATVRAVVDATARFSVGNPVLAQLLFTRPVPGFVPSAEAYAPSLEVFEMVAGAVAEAVAVGDLAAEAATPDGVQLLVAVAAGVISQQAANDPDAGEPSPLLGTALEMYASFYRPGSARHKA